MTHEVLGAIELTSIARGMETLDSMVKASPVEILSAGMLNPGKYLILISGTVASVEMALDAGVAAGEDSLVDHILIPYLNSQVLPALETSREPERWDALGILETLSAVCAIEGADRAVKAAGVTLLSISTGNELGGKALFRISGAVGEVQAAMAAAVELARGKGQLLRDVIIPGPHTDIKGFVCGN